MRHKIVMVMLSVALIVGLVLIGCVEPAAPPVTPPEEPVEEPEPEPEQEREPHLIFGSGSKPLSGYFPYHTVVFQLVDAAPGVRFTMTLPGGSVAGALEILRGEMDMTGGLAMAAWYQMTRGLGKFEGQAVPNDLRALFSSATGICPLLVRVDSDIDTVYDFDGKLYMSGLQGSSGEVLLTAAFEALGIEVETYRGSYTDAVADIKDGRLIGCSKNMKGHSLDPGMMDVQTRIPIKIVSFTESDVEKVKSKVPYVTFMTLKANHYVQLEHPEVIVLTTPTMWVCHKDLDEVIAYEITKSYAEGFEEKLLKVFGEDMANAHPLETPSFVGRCEDVYIHPGAIRYYREMGVEIPDSVVPPEMK